MSTAEADGATELSSSYLDYLPAIYREGADAFLGRYLLAFEKVLTGLGDVDEPGLEEKLEGIPSEGLAGVERYFEPGPDLDDGQRAPSEFLEWLAGWVAMTFRADVDESRRRTLIANAVQLYRKRGTKEGLQELIGIYTLGKSSVEIDELNDRLQLGVTSTLGVDTRLDGGAPHAFHVLVRLPTVDEADREAQLRLVAAIIDAERPAHTRYQLDWDAPAMQIGVRSKLGVDTLLSGPRAATQT